MEKELLRLPLLVGGEEIYTDDTFRLEYEDLVIEYPVLNDANREKVLSMDRYMIRNTTLDEITGFLEKVSRLWIDENYPLRKKLLEYGPRVTGQSPEMIMHSFAVVLQLISFKECMMDEVEYELGDKRLLDEWVSKVNAEIHAEPLGRLVHIISGNVSVVGLFSIIRGILTKNVNIIKLSQKDFLTSYLFIRSFYDVDPEHPVTKTIAAVYWSSTDFINMDHFCNNANGLIVWGGYDTIKAYKSRCAVGCEFIEYGPKKGIQIIQYDENSDRNLELNVARDISVFDQEACLSPQLILIKGNNIKKFMIMVMKGLMEYKNLWPPAKHSIDHYAHINYIQKSHEFLGNTAWTSDERDWMVVKVNDLSEVKLGHPLGRTIFVKEIQDFDECFDYIDSTVQTVGIAPKSLARELRDKLSMRGVTRIANIGSVEMPREGLYHEGISLSRFVRIVGMDKEADYHEKIYDVPEGYFNQFVYSIKWKEEN